MTSLPLYTPPKRKARPEARLQKAVVQHLLLAANPGVIWFAVPNEGRRSARGGAEAKRMGLRPGVADLCVIVQGRAHFLELKSEKGRPSETQIDFRDDCLAAGIPYRMASSINDALAILTEWGAIRRDRNMRRAA